MNTKQNRERWDRAVESINESLSKLYLAPSDIHGVGVFTREDIKKGEKVYAGDLPAVFDLPFSYIKKLKKPVRDEIVGMFPYIVKNNTKIHKKFMYPPATFVLYMNHSDKPNYDPLEDAAKRNIKAGEEVVEDYRTIEGDKTIYKFLKK